jgi:hypothetical protein
MFDCNHAAMIDDPDKGYLAYTQMGLCREPASILLFGNPYMSDYAANIKITNIPVDGNYAICAPVEFLTQYRNAAKDSLYEPELHIYYPGLVWTPGSFQYKQDNGAWTPLTNVYNQNDSLILTLPTNTFLAPYKSLSGYDSLYIKFEGTPSCNFTNDTYVDAYFSVRRGCGGVLEKRNQTEMIHIDGLPTQTNVTLSADTVRSVGYSLSDSLKITNVQYSFQPSANTHATIKVFGGIEYAGFINNGGTIIPNFVQSGNGEWKAAIPSGSFVLIKGHCLFKVTDPARWTSCDAEASVVMGLVIEDTIECPVGNKCIINSTVVTPIERIFKIHKNNVTLIDAPMLEITQVGGKAQLKALNGTRAGHVKNNMTFPVTTYGHYFIDKNNNGYYDAGIDYIINNTANAGKVNTPNNIAPNATAAFPVDIQTILPSISLDSLCYLWFMLDDPALCNIQYARPNLKYIFQDTIKELCQGNPAGVVVGDLAVPGTSYLWEITSPATISPTNIAQPTVYYNYAALIDPSPWTATARVSIIPPGGCIIRGDVTVEVNAKHLIERVSGITNQSVCSGSTTDSVIFRLLGGATSANITWSPALAGLPSTLMPTSTPKHFALYFTMPATATNGIYRYTIVTAGNSCNEDTLRGEITVTSGPDILTQLRDTTVCLGNAIHYIPTIETHGSFIRNYTWTLAYRLTPTSPLILDTIATTPHLTYTPIVADDGKELIFTVENACGTAESKAMLHVLSSSTNVIWRISSNNSCQGGTVYFDASPFSGQPYIWQISTDKNIWNNANGTYTNQNYSTDQLIGTAAGSTYYFRRLVGTQSVCQPPSNIDSVTIYYIGGENKLNPIDTLICAGSSVKLEPTQSLSGTGSITWNMSHDGTTWSIISGATGPDYTTPALYQKTIYRKDYHYIIGLDTVCQSPSNLAFVYVYNDTANSIPSLQSITVCKANPATITPSAVNASDYGTGVSVTYNWQWSSDNSTWNNFTPLRTNDTLKLTAVNATTYYRRQVSVNSSKGSCTNNVGISTAKITVFDNVADNHITAITPDTICNGKNTSVTITGSDLSAVQGFIAYLWQQSIDGGTTFATASGTNNQKDYTTANAIQTTLYRRLVRRAIVCKCRAIR